MGGVSTALEEGSRSKDTPFMVSGRKRERMGTNTSRFEACHLDENVPL